MQFARLIVLIATLLSLPAYAMAGSSRADDCGHKGTTANHVAHAGKCCPDTCKLPTKPIQCGICELAAGFSGIDTDYFFAIASISFKTAGEAVVHTTATHFSSQWPDGLLRPPTQI